MLRYRLTADKQSPGTLAFGRAAG